MANLHTPVKNVVANWWKGVGQATGRVTGPLTSAVTSTTGAISGAATPFKKPAAIVGIGSIALLAAGLFAGTMKSGKKFDPTNPPLAHDPDMALVQPVMASSAYLPGGPLDGRGDEDWRRTVQAQRAGIPINRTPNSDLVTEGAQDLGAVQPSVRT